MASPVWFLIASLFLVSIDGKAIYNGAQSSSSAPQSSVSSGRKLAGQKDLVLYLTPEQVEVLEAAGAVVKPLPEYEKTLQQSPQQSVEEQTESQEQSEEDAEQEPEIEQYYKVVNIQQINEDLKGQGQAAEQNSEKPRQKYRYTSKSRQPNYAALYVQKKSNKDKTPSTAYVRYLPNYETENVKMESYRAKPIPGYRFKGSQEDLEIVKYFITEAPEIVKSNENPQTSEKSQQEEARPTRTKKPARAQQESPAEKNEEKGPVTFEGNVREPAKVLKSSKVKQQSKGWVSVKTSETTKVQEEPEEVEILSQQEFIKKIKALARKQEQKPKKTTAAVERQYASLLAPLIQHKKITEALAKEKEELAKNERDIQNKLIQLKESGSDDEELYAIELRKLSENLHKQNLLAEKLAQQGITKNSGPEVTEKPEEEEESSDEQAEEEEEEREQGSEEQAEEEEAEEAEEGGEAEGEEEEEEEEVVTPKRAQTTEQKKRKQVDPTPIVVRIPDNVNQPQFYPVSFDFLRDLEQRARKVEQQKPAPVEKRIRLPEAGNVYFRPNKPYAVQQPENLAILRHLWEH